MFAVQTSPSKHFSFFTLLFLLNLFSLLLFPCSLLSQDWQWQNPLPQGNSLTDIKILDESTAIAVGSVGTVLRTIDGGTSWQVQQYAGGSTEDLSSVYFAGNGGWAVGANGTVLRSTDSGSSWSALQSGTESYLSSTFFINATTGWVVGSGGIILKTTDAGSTWVSQYSGSTEEALSAVFFVDADTGWAVGGLFAEGNTILHTTNGGTSWTHQSGGWPNYLSSVFFVDVTTGWIVGQNGLILHTTNRGEIWAIQASGTTQQLRSVFFTNADIGWVIGFNGTILMTSNGGSTWVLQSSGTTSILSSVHFNTPSTGWIVGLHGILLQTINGGQSWILRTSGVTETVFSSFSATEDTGWAVGSLGRILKTIDGGRTWMPQQSGTNTSLHSVFFVDGNKGWVAGGDWPDVSTILHTTDGGSIWTEQQSGASSSLYSIRFTNSDNGWAVGANGTILRTTNGGASWVLQTGGLNHVLWSVFFTDANTGWIAGGTAEGDEGILLKTLNGGVTWNLQTIGSYPLHDVQFANANTGWVRSSWVIYGTTDGGSTWTSQRQTIVGMGSLFVIDANIAFSSWDGTVLKTTDGGTSWVSQLRGADTEIRSTFFSDANIGWAVGGSGTILKTSTGGTGIEPPAAPSLFSPDDGSIVSTDPSLSWNLSPRALWYTVQVSTSPYFIVYKLNQSNIPGTSYQLNGLEEGVTHFWRVSLTDSTGTSSWSETWTFFVADVPEQVSPLTPVDGATVTSDSTTLVWRHSTPVVDRYWIEGDEDSLFASPFVDSLLTDTMRTVGFLEHNQSYWWRVRAHNEVGWGPFSEVRSFFVFQEIPAPPVLLSPPNGATEVPTSVTVSWSPSLGAESYALQVSDTSDFSTLLVNQDGVNTTSLNVSGLSIGSTYYWRVSATNPVGTSPWSEVWSFTTFLPLPNQVQLLAPEHNIQITVDSVLCLWEQSKSAVDRYWFEYASDSIFTTSVIDSTLEDTTTTIPGLTNNDYYWRVRAHNSAGWGPFSDVWSFSVLITGVEDLSGIPREFTLSQNYPNPFNPSTVIRYGLPERAHVRLDVFNVIGQRVAVLVDEEKGAGWHEVVLDGSGLSSGMYVYRLNTNTFIETKGFLLLR